MSNSIDTLRDHLFAAPASLGDKESPMDIDRAKAICDVGQVIINSAKVEVEYARVTGKAGSAFLEKPTAMPAGITGVTQHRIK